jgi:hypothetical protein
MSVKKPQMLSENDNFLHTWSLISSHENYIYFSAFNDCLNVMEKHSRLTVSTKAMEHVFANEGTNITRAFASEFGSKELHQRDNTFVLNRPEINRVRNSSWLPTA